MSRKVWFIAVLSIAMLALVAGQAMAKNKEAKAFLGIVPAELTSDLAADYGIKGGAGSGVVVNGVTSDSPADKIGLRENDVIVKINDANVTGPEELRAQLAKYKSGDEVNIVYVRGGKERTAKVELADRGSDTFSWSPKAMSKSFSFEGPPWEWNSDKEGKKVAFAGIVTQELSDGLASYFKVDKGVLISEVVDDSPADKAGLKAGDVILKIGDEEVEDTGDVRRAIRDHETGENVDFAIRRNGEDMTIAVTLGEQQLGMNDGDLENLRVFTDEDGGNIHVRVAPSPEELKDLQRELEELKIDLKDIPDIDVKVLPNRGIISVPSAPNSATTVNYQSAWKTSLEKFQGEIMQAMMKLRAQIEYMKMKILEMKEEILKATA